MLSGMINYSYYLQMGSCGNQAHDCVLVCYALPFMLDHYVMFWSVVLWCGPGGEETGPSAEWPKGGGGVA